MVYPDISEAQYCHQKAQFKNSQAAVLQRILAVVIDYFILSPVVSFVCVVLFSEGLKLYKQFPDSAEAKIILIQIGIGFVFLFTLIQSIFIFFTGGTPGQIFTKTFISFDLGNQSRYSAHIFFQAWFRQIGFVISILLLGIPFLSVFYHEQRRTIFERMTESSVLTTIVHPVAILNWGQSERRYISVFISTFIFFTVGLMILGFQNYYTQILSSNLTYQKNKNENVFCKEMDAVSQENRINVATALNLVGILPDRCLDIEADFILWRNFNVSSNFESKSMAYFAKYLTASSDDVEDQYLNKVCDENINSEACDIARNFKSGDFKQLLDNLKSKKPNLLNAILIYETSEYLNLDRFDLLQDIEKYSTFKPINKYVIHEKISYLIEQKKTRQPANENNISNEIIEIQKRIDDL